MVIRRLETAKKLLVIVCLITLGPVRSSGSGSQDAPELPGSTYSWDIEASTTEPTVPETEASQVHESTDGNLVTGCQHGEEFMKVGEKLPLPGCGQITCERGNGTLHLVSRKCEMPRDLDYGCHVVTDPRDAFPKCCEVAIVCKQVFTRENITELNLNETENFIEGINRISGEPNSVGLTFDDVSAKANGSEPALTERHERNKRNADSESSLKGCSLNGDTISPGKNISLKGCSQLQCFPDGAGFTLAIVSCGSSSRRAAPEGCEVVPTTTSEFPDCCETVMKCKSVATTVIPIIYTSGNLTEEDDLVSKEAVSKIIRSNDAPKDLHQMKMITSESKVTNPIILGLGSMKNRRSRRAKAGKESPPGKDDDRSLSDRSRRFADSKIGLRSKPTFFLPSRTRNGKRSRNRNAISEETGNEDLLALELKDSMFITLPPATMKTKNKKKKKKKKDESKNEEKSKKRRRLSALLSSRNLRDVKPKKTEKSPQMKAEGTTTKEATTKKPKRRRRIKPPSKSQNSSESSRALKRKQLFASRFSKYSPKKREEQKDDTKTEKNKQEKPKRTKEVKKTKKEDDKDEKATSGDDKTKEEEDRKKKQALLRRLSARRRGLKRPTHKKDKEKDERNEENPEAEKITPSQTRGARSEIKKKQEGKKVSPSRTRGGKEENKDIEEEGNESLIRTRGGRHESKKKEEREKESLSRARAERQETKKKQEEKKPKLRTRGGREESKDKKEEEEEEEEKELLSRMRGARHEIKKKQEDKKEEESQTNITKTRTRNRKKNKEATTDTEDNKRKNLRRGRYQRRKTKVSNEKRKTKPSFDLKAVENKKKEEEEKEKGTEKKRTRGKKVFDVQKIELKKKESKSTKSTPSRRRNSSRRTNSTRRVNKQKDTPKTEEKKEPKPSEDSENEIEPKEKKAETKKKETEEISEKGDTADEEKSETPDLEPPLVTIPPLFDSLYKVEYPSFNIDDFDKFYSYPSEDLHFSSSDKENAKSPNPEENEIPEIPELPMKVTSVSFSTSRRSFKSSKTRNTSKNFKENPTVYDSQETFKAEKFR